MASVSDCFSIGSTVACTTVFDQEIVGKFLKFTVNYPTTNLLTTRLIRGLLLKFFLNAVLTHPCAKLFIFTCN